MRTSYRPSGLIRCDLSGAHRGYTLFSPNGGDDAYLIDMEGNFVHRWHYPGGIAYGFLLDNGNLLFRDLGPTLRALTTSVSWTGTAGWSGNTTPPAGDATPACPMATPSSPKARRAGLTQLWPSRARNPLEPSLRAKRGNLAPGT